MRAAVYHGREDLRIESVPDPGEPGENELRIEVLRAAICGTDSSEYFSGPRMIPLTRRHPGSGHVGPTVIGHEFVGEVVERGSAVDRFEPGDRVVCGAGVSCGTCAWCLRGETNLCESYYTLGLSTHGGMADAVISPADICSKVPGGVSDDDASMSQPLAVAIHALDKGDPGPGDSVVIIGCGGIGALMVGAAAPRDFGQVIAVDIDTGKLNAAKALGADLTIDARHEDTAGVIREATGGVGADVVFEASGATESTSVGIRASRAGGKVVTVGHPTEPVPVDLADAGLREVDLIGTVAHICDSDIPAAIELLASTPIADLVEKGLTPLAEGNASGKIVVDVTA
jgi:threonine dehydrogenase-like Zn-dependent dehydrogenase